MAFYVKIEELCSIYQSPTYVLPMYYHVYQLRKRKPWLKLCAFLKEHSVGKMIVLYCVHQIITVPPTGCLVNECVRIQLSVHFTAPDESVTVDIMLVCVGRGGWRAYSFCSQNSPFTVSDSPNPNKPSASFILWNSYTNVELHDSYIKVHWFFFLVFYWFMKALKVVSVLVTVTVLRSGFEVGSRTGI